MAATGTRSLPVRFPLFPSFWLIIAPDRMHPMARLPRMSRSQAAFAALSLLVGLLLGVDTPASAQVVVYRPVVPMFAPAAGPYVANYTPSGNYAAVTAFSPPVVESYAMPVAAPAMAAMPVTSYYAPTYAAPAATTAYYGSPAMVESPVAVATPVTAYYAPAVQTAYYAPAATTAYYAPAATTAYYAPAAVAVPLYRRGLFGAYRPVRGAYFPAY
jgi:hypothetical protein